MGQPVLPNSLGDSDAKYVDVIHCILADSETMEITQCQFEFLEASTRYYYFRNRTDKLNEEISSEEYAKRISEQHNRRKILDKMFNKAVEEEQEKSREEALEALKAAQEEEDRKNTEDTLKYDQ